MRRPSITFLLLLFALFAVLTVAAANADITDAEARLLWIVRDPERIEPASISDTARLLTRNFRAMLDRAETRDLPLAVPLDIWTTLTGGSIFAARMPVACIICLGAAVFIRLVSRRRRGNLLIAALSIIAIGVALQAIISAPPYYLSTQAVVREYRFTRSLDEPVITVFRDDSPLGYYQAQYNLRRGIGVDLGWREFTSDEVERVVANMGSGPIWVIADGYDTLGLNDVLTATGRRLTFCWGKYRWTSAMRYDFADGDTAIQDYCVHDS
jgi:hypothetical protein